MNKVCRGEPKFSVFIRAKGRSKKNYLIKDFCFQRNNWRQFSTGGGQRVASIELHVADKRGVQTRSQGLLSFFLLDWSGKTRRREEERLGTRLSGVASFPLFTWSEDIVVLRSS